MLIIFLTILTFFHVVQAQTSLQMSSFSASPNTIGSTSQISFIITMNPFGSFSVPSGALLVLSFPSGFTNAAPSCSIISTVATLPNPMPTSPSCSSASSQISITTGLSSAKLFNSITITITGFTNPNAIDYTGFFGFRILDSASAVSAKIPDNMYKLTLDKVRFNQCLFTSLSSTVVGATVNLVLSLNSANGIPAGGTIKIETPVWDSYAVTPNLKYFGQTSVTCTGGTPNVSPSVSCSFDTSTGIITISNGFSTLTTGAIQININNLRNPQSTATSPKFNVASYTSSGTAYEYCDDMTYQATTPGSISGWSISCEQTKINSFGYCDMKFKTSNPLSGPSTSQLNQCNIVITVPSEMSISSVASILFAQPSTEINSGITPVVSGNTIALNNIINSNKQIAKNVEIQLVITTFKMPASLAPTSSFSITTYSGTFKIDETTTGLTTQATQGDDLTVNSLSADDTVAGRTTNYNFDITLTSPLLPASGLYIKFPSVFALSASCALSSVSSNINGASPTCTSDTTNNVITLSNLFTAQISAGQTLTFKVSGVRNPQSTEPTTTLIIRSLLSSSNSASIVDQNQAQTVNFITFNTLDVSSIVMTPTSSVTSVVTTYTFGFTNNNPCPTGGKVEIKFTSGVITFPFKTNTEASLVAVTNINSAGVVSIQTVGSDTVITLSNAFTTNYATGTSFSFKLSFIKNPPTTQPFTNIVFSTYTLGGYIIDKLIPGYSLQITDPHPFDSILIVPSTLLNGMTGNYQVTVTFKENHFNGDKLLIDFPAGVSLTLASATLLAGSNTDVTISSSQSSNSATITMSTAVTSIVAGSKVIISITSLKNVVFSSAIGTFTITSTDSGGFFRAKSTYSNPSFITEPAILPVPQTKLTPSNTILSQTGTDYQFQIERVNSMGAGGSIEIAFPTEITAPTSPVCSNFGGIAGIACSYTAPNKIVVTGTFDSMPTLLIFTVSGITNPSVSVSGSFTITTKTSGSVIVDTRTTDLRFNADCDLPCKQCTGVRTTCTSCFTDVSSLLKYLSGTTCVSACPTGTVNVNGVCTSCILPCTECTGTPTNCTKCQTSVPQLYVSAGSCVTSCPPTFYKEDSTFTCAPCSTQCDTCQTYDKCLSCPSGKKLYNLSCLSSCPASITVDVANICQPCNTNCTGCTTTVNTCTGCNAGLILYNFQCIASCPSTLYYSSASSTCLPCTSPCNDCSGSATTCTSCITGKFLSGNTCVDTCPSGTYPNSGTQQCAPCPSTCLNCTSSTFCIDCKAPNLLYANSCGSTCPTGTVASGLTCVSCTIGCSACSGLPTTCTACLTGYRRVGTTCQTACSPGTYDDGTNCASCHTSCATCNGGGTTNCLSCNNGTNPYLTPSSTCSNVCPAKYYGDSATNQCRPCNAACATCFGPAATECSACDTSLYFYGTTCIIQCPLGTTVPINGICQNCDTTSCKTCSVLTNNCTSCQTGLTLKVDKTTNFYYCENASVIILPGTSGSSSPSTTAASSSEIVPFPFLILSLTFTIMIVGSKAASNETNLPGNLFAFLSLLFFGATITYIILNLVSVNFSISFTSAYYHILLAILGMILNYFYGILHFCYIVNLMRTDQSFKKWREAKGNNIISIFLLIFSLPTTFQFYRVIYDKLFGVSLFSATIKTNDPFKAINCLTVFNMLLSCIPIIGGVAYNFSKGGFVLNQTYVEGLEVLILGPFCVLLCIWDLFTTRNPNTYNVSNKIASEKPSRVAFNPEKEKPTATDLNKSKLGLLEDDTKLEGLDQDSYYISDTASKKTRNYNQVKAANRNKDDLEQPNIANELGDTRGLTYMEKSNRVIDDDLAIRNITDENLFDDTSRANPNVIFRKSSIGDYVTDSPNKDEKGIARNHSRHMARPDLNEERGYESKRSNHLNEPYGRSRKGGDSDRRTNKIGDQDRPNITKGQPSQKTDTSIRNNTTARSTKSTDLKRVKQEGSSAKQKKDSPEARIKASPPKSVEEEKNMPEEEKDDTLKLFEIDEDENAGEIQQPINKKTLPKQQIQKSQLKRGPNNRKERSADDRSSTYDNRNNVSDLEITQDHIEPKQTVAKSKGANIQESVILQKDEKAPDTNEGKPDISLGDEEILKELEASKSLKKPVSNNKGLTGDDKVEGGKDDVNKVSPKKAAEKRYASEKDTNRSANLKGESPPRENNKAEYKKSPNKMESQVYTQSELEEKTKSGDFPFSKGVEGKFPFNISEISLGETGTNGNPSKIQSLKKPVEQDNRLKQGVGEIIPSIPQNLNPNAINIEKPKQEKKVEKDFEFCDDSKASVSDVDNFANEESPSQYNVLNQRYEDEHFAPSHVKEADNYISLVSPVGSLTKVGSPQMIKKVFPQRTNTMLTEKITSSDKNFAGINDSSGMKQQKYTTRVMNALKEQDLRMSKEQARSSDENLVEFKHNESDVGNSKKEDKK